MACRENEGQFARIAACFLVIAILGIAILRQQGSDNVITLGILVAALLDIVGLLTYTNRRLRLRSAPAIRDPGEGDVAEELSDAS